MKPLKIHIDYNALDAYLYAGQLFLICKDGTLKSIPLWKLIKSNLKSKSLSEEFSMFQFAFDKNNWLNNTQAELFLGINGMYTSFNKAWSKISNMEFSFTIDEDDIVTLCEIPHMPVFDFQLYGMRLFIGNRKGLFEAGISNDYKDDIHLNEKLDKVIDSRITNISAKVGSLMLSSNSDGLFHGQLLNINERVEVGQKAIQDKSLRTDWTGYDIINYESQNNFDYLKTFYVREENRNYLYSAGDEDSKKIRIKKIDDVIPMDYLLENAHFDSSEILYSFSSPKACFFFLNNGKIFHTNWNRFHDGEKKIALRSNFQELPSLFKKEIIQKPITANTVSKDFHVLEYFDRVLLLQNDKVFTLEEKGVASVRTYNSSIRYRNLITTTDGEGINIFSVYPYL